VSTGIQKSFYKKINCSYKITKASMVKLKVDYIFKKGGGERGNLGSPLFMKHFNYPLFIMTTIITIPNPIIENSPATLIYNNPASIPVSGNSYVLKNSLGNNVSNVFTYNANKTPTLYETLPLPKSQSVGVVDNNNILYTADYNNQIVYKKISNGSPMPMLSAPLLRYPAGLTIDNQNNLYISNGGSNSGSPFNGYIVKYNLITNIVDPLFDRTPSYIKQLTGIVYNLNNNTLYACSYDGDIYLINQITGAKSFIFSVGASAFKQITYDMSNNLYVTTTNSVVKISNLLTTPTKTTLPNLGFLIQPTGIVVDSTNNLCIADLSGNLITYYSLSLNTPFPGRSLTIGQPYFLALDPYGNLFVSQGNLGTVSTFDYTNFILYFTFTNLILPAGLNTLSIYNINTEKTVANDIVVNVLQNVPCIGLGPGYSPNPTRVWSRVQSACSYQPTSVADMVYIPFLKKTIPCNQVAEAYQIYYKGNILQYKKNSQDLTKQLRYSKIAKGEWTNRNTTWASQSQTFTEPNTNSLKRVNYTHILASTGQETNLPLTCSIPVTGVTPATLPVPAIPSGQGNNSTLPPFGAPVNPYPPNTLPFNPYNVNADTAPVVIANGGSLICNTVENICTGQILSQTSQNFCNLTSASDVPGPERLLCFNSGLQTWYPRQRFTMSSSGNKFPTNYPLLKSANEIPSVK